MSLCDITEFNALPVDGHGRALPITPAAALVEQQVSVSGTSAQSAALGSSTTIARIVADVAIRYAYGASPTASSTSRLLPAGAVEHLGVAPGYKIAVIAA